MKALTMVVLLVGLAAQAEDRLHLSDGQVFRGQIRNLASSLIEMDVVLRGVQGSARRQFETHRVEFIEFQRLPGQVEALADPASHQTELLELWRQTSVHLRWPVHPAGEIGLALADVLLKQDQTELLERAFRIYSLIEKDDWDEARRNLAQRGRLRSLIRLERIEEAITEAQQVARQSEDPELLIEAQQVLAAADFEKLKRFEEDHPRWDLDEEQSAERWALYHQTLDGFLHTPLFHGSRQPPSAEALWQVVQVHLFAKEPTLARQHAEDLIQLYPSSSPADQAKALLGTPPSTE